MIWTTEWFQCPSAFLAHGFEHWSIQTNDLYIHACCFLARCLALLGYGNDWLVQCHDNVARWDIDQVMVLVPWSPSWTALYSRCTITSWYPPWYDLRCCHDVKTSRTNRLQSITYSHTFNAGTHSYHTSANTHTDNIIVLILYVDLRTPNQTGDILITSSRQVYRQATCQNSFSQPRKTHIYTHGYI